MCRDKQNVKVDVLRIRKENQIMNKKNINNVMDFVEELKGKLEELTNDLGEIYDSLDNKEFLKANNLMKYVNKEIYKLSDESVTLNGKVGDLFNEFVEEVTSDENLGFKSIKIEKVSA